MAGFFIKHRHIAWFDKRGREVRFKKILTHLDLWDVKRKPLPRANEPPSEAFIIYYESSAPSADDYIIDAD